MQRAGRKADESIGAIWYKGRVGGRRWCLASAREGGRKVVIVKGAYHALGTGDEDEDHGRGKRR